MVDERTQWLMPVVELAKKAGAGILEYYGSSPKKLDISQKSDNTFLTKADVAAHDIITKGLKKLTPDIPVLSEEDVIPAYEKRAEWSRYWLLDPLDGTRGFIENMDEFTVNIALIENHVPVLGVVYAPVFHMCYYAVHQGGAFGQCGDQVAHPIQTRQMNWASYDVLLGHFLHSSRMPQLFEGIKGAHVVRLNSSLKFCWIAEGRGDFYPRLGDTSEWDSAAAHCVLNEAGGAVVDLNGKPLQYNAKESLVNPPFIALGDPAQRDKIIKLVQ